MDAEKKQAPDGVIAALQMRDSMDAQRDAIQDIEAPRLNFHDFIFDTTTEPAPPDYLLEIGGCPLMPRGGLTVVTGQAKSGKTSFLTAMVATMMSGRDFGMMERRTSPGKILWVDTEQSENDMSFAFERLFRQAEIPLRDDSQKHDLIILKTRPLSPEQRLQVMLDAVAEITPSVLILDGLRDLLHDFNDIKQSNVIVTALLKLLDTYPAMNVVGVLHQNPKDDKMRGHLGTEALNKARDIFVCEKENGVFKVTHESRHRQVRGAFVFRIAEDGRTLEVSTIEAARGGMDAEEAFIAAVPEDGARWMEIVTEYKKLTNITKQDAITILDKRRRDGDLVQNMKTKLYHRKK
jgi:KaiC/GvpD/RAD55 family RecA-like ATPase